MAVQFEKPIALGADHGGYELKEAIKRHLEERSIAYRDFGTNSTASCDYPDYAAATCGAVTNGSSDFAILCCGTGVGMSMCANKIKGIRACCCSEPFSAEYTRRHNNANTLCLGGRPQIRGPKRRQRSGRQGRGPQRGRPGTGYWRCCGGGCTRH